MKKFLLKDIQSLNHCIRWFNSCYSSMLKKTPIEVTIKNFVRLTKDQELSAVQNRLRWLWITDISKEMGLYKDECNQFLKERFLLPIFVRDNEEWANTMFAIRQLEVDGYKDTAKQLNAFVTDEKRLSLLDATVKQGAEFLDEVKSFAHEQLRMTLKTDLEYK
jgi:hypothetical protein